ncbi:MAG TPA: carboxylating nicotinate-nucleotide diphosphorylase [Candidatus Dormibacteraeota bacterium]|nr:carboxylating nicotinate-nucleotide diphosphorylase [Candidatus Dormibacteraeota bacterium]
MRHPYEEHATFAPLDAEGAAAFDPVLLAALDEDVGGGDVTTLALIPADAEAHGAIASRRAGVAAGIPLAARVFALVDPRVQVRMAAADGDRLLPGDVLLRVDGPARGILTAERVALNVLGRLCGIATLTRRYVDAVGGAGTRIVDTRKTTPGLRALERYAVRAGGGCNHRTGLYDAILIKDNHLAVVGSVRAALERAMADAPQGMPIEVECDSLDQVREALNAGARAILLDNMALDAMREAVAMARGRAVLEASGGILLERIPEIAATGVDLISVGALTHSVPALDVGLDFSPQDQGARRTQRNLA